MNQKELKDFLDEKVLRYNSTSFIESDPIQIPHRFQKKEDIEISAFLVATIAWGNRKSIINNGIRLMDLLDQAPYDFILNHSEQDLKTLLPFVHRTFNGNDLSYFIKALKYIYTEKNGLEAIFSKAATPLVHNPPFMHSRKPFLSCLTSQELKNI